MAKYYVDPVNGSDAAAGTSFATAWKTTAYAVSSAVENDTIALCATGIETLAATVAWNAKRLSLVGHSSTGAHDGTLYQIRGPAGGPVFSINGYGIMSHIELLLDTTTPHAPIAVTGLRQVLFKCRSVGAVDYFCRNADTASYYISLLSCDIRNASLGIFYHTTVNRHSVEKISSCYIKNCYNIFVGALQSAKCFIDSSILVNTNITTNLYTGVCVINNSVLWNSELLLGDRDSATINTIVTNSVLAASTNSGEAAIRWWSAANYSPAVVDNCLFWGNTNDTINAPSSFFLGPGCITGVDPGFTDPANDDFSYGATSPLVGAGALGVG